MIDPLLGLAENRRSGKPIGITSVCSAHPIVIRAAIRNAALRDESVLIEATCNQVNQFGGYTGMRPGDFVALVSRIAADEGLAMDRIILGGDHLGPNPWKTEPAETAMAKAEAMVRDYVEAGFRKLHLDCSMGCAEEPPALDDATTAGRAVRLAKVAEATSADSGGPEPVYIIGTEVPPPGGAHHVITELEPTAVEDAKTTIDIHRKLFAEAGLEQAFGRVLAIVVQPGVEFGNENVILYDREKAHKLTRLLETEPALVYEAHSTDYQGRGPLRQLVEDGFAILKVGPELTFALRETIYGLDMIATDLLSGYPPRLIHRTMERLMLDKPVYWQGHYHGDKGQLRFQRHYSYSDRIRYYWNFPEAEAAIGRLHSALDGIRVPAPLLRQYLPAFSDWTERPMDTAAMLVAAVQRVLDEYRHACLR